ncbi:hypothetical protein ABPG75_005779 [Micractinium tetrahymenae]
MDSDNDPSTEAMEQNGALKLEDEAPALRLRLLCPQALVPALIGKKGDNIKRIRRDSGAAISVADPVHGCDERVVHIMGESLDDTESTCAADALVAVFESICLAQQAARGHDGSVGAVTASAPSPQLPSPQSEEMCSASGSGAGSMADAGSGAASSAASTAGEHSVGALGGGSSGPASITASTQSLRPVEARLLVDSALVGYLVGRGGSTIKETIARSGAGVRVLPKPDLPTCACVGDEVVRVCGSAGAVGAALRLLAGQIKAHPLRLGSLPYAAPGGGHCVPLMLAQATQGDLAYMHPSLGGYFTHGAAAPGAGGMVGAPVGAAGAAGVGGFGGTQVEVTFRLLAPVARTGNIIGKGGDHVRRVRQETGARIKVYDPAPGSEERVVALTSIEDAISPYCAAQDALIRCVIALTADDASAASHRVRLLTAQASVGMVLGKRGATVSQLRQETGAAIKVLPAEAVPPAFGGGLGSDDSEAELGSISSGGGGMGSGGGGLSSGSGGLSAEEVVQVEGSVQQCVAALRGVATLLRGWQIRRLMSLQHQHQQQFGGGVGAVAAAAAMQLPLPSMPMSPTAANHSGHGAPGSPGMLGVQLPSSLGSPMQPSYMVMSSLQLPSGAMMSPPPPPPPVSPVQQPRPLQYVYHLDNAQVGAVLGKGGAHIAQIRQMSGARVQLQGEGEGGGRMLVVAGQPDQCNTAHSMANAFLSMGHCEPAYPEPMMG